MQPVCSILGVLWARYGKAVDKLISLMLGDYEVYGLCPYKKNRAAVAQLSGQCAGLQVSKLSEWSCTWGMGHSKIHVISLGCPQPSVALQCWIVAPHHSFHFLIRYIYIIITRSLLQNSDSMKYCALGHSVTTLHIISLYLYWIYWSSECIETSSCSKQHHSTKSPLFVLKFLSTTAF